MSRSHCGRDAQTAQCVVFPPRCDDLNRRRQALLDEALAGSRDAHGELLNTYVPTMASFFRRRLSRKLAVKTGPLDLAQDACAAALSGFGGFAGSRLAQYAAWLAGICRILVKKLLRAFAPGGGRDVARVTPLDHLVSQAAGEDNLGRMAAISPVFFALTRTPSVPVRRISKACAQARAAASSTMSNGSVLAIPGAIISRSPEPNPPVTRSKSRGATVSTRTHASAFSEGTSNPFNSPWRSSPMTACGTNTR